MENLFKQAQQYIPGGVNSPVRAFKAVEGTPIFIQSAHGSTITDTNGKSYIDYVGSWGPMILGHAHPKVIEAVQQTAADGLSFGAPTVLETQMAKKVCQLVPSIEKVRMVSSGTEATMSAIRLARGVTGRDKIVKFEGCYHGHGDSLLVKAGSGALTLGTPSSPGVPKELASDTITVSYNQLNEVESVFEQFGEQIACIIVEPIAGNMNCVLPIAGFLEGLRNVCDRYQSILIFDEVMTGFRVALGGAQERYGVIPDVTTLGKIIGGGLPVGAFGGKAEIMDQLAPNGPVYQAGTLSGNPVAMSAGLTTLNLLSEEGFYKKLENKTNKLASGLIQAANAHNISLSTNQAGGMFGFFFSDEENITRFDQVTRCNGDRFKQFFHQMLKAGIYLAPSSYEAAFVSAAHTDEDIERTLECANQAFSNLRTL